MENEDRPGRKRTLFRRTRDSGAFDSPPLGALDDDLADSGWVDISANPQAQAVLDAEQRAASPRKTASMFAPKEKWTETWGDDAWDDEWSDPTARRSSVPPAASPGPDQIDAWLSTDSESWGDVTRETIQKMGADPKVVDAPGATWDTDQKAQRSSTTPPSDIELAIERALASVSAEVAPLTEPTSQPRAEAPMLVVDSRLSTPATPKTRFRRGATNLVATNPAASAAVPERQTNEYRHETVDLTIQAPASEALEGRNEATDTEREIDRVIDSVIEDGANDESASIQIPVADVLEPTISIPTVSIPTVSVLTIADVPTVLTSIPAVSVTKSSEPASGGFEMVDTTITKMTANPPVKVTATAADWVSDTDATGDLSVTAPEQTGLGKLIYSGRAYSFVDRVSWIGCGVALVAAIRLIVLLWAGSRTASPAGGLNAIERIGRGFSDAGVVQALLLIVAVALLIVPSLFDGEERSGRIGTGLGLVIGASTLGVIGSLFAFLSDRRLADIAGNASGSVTLRALAALVATAGMSIVAWAAAVRSLRSDV